MNRNRKCVQTIFVDVRGYYEIAVFEILTVDCTYIMIQSQ